MAEEALDPAVVSYLALNAKFARAVHAVEKVTKSKTAKINATFSYTYADLSDVLEAIKDALNTEGLAMSQYVNVLGETRQQLMTVIIDMETGDQVEFGGPAFPITGDAQATGSALTYHRRYSLTTLFSMQVGDDDGAQATRAARDPQNRTPAESEIRKGLAGLDKGLQGEFAADFKEQFGSTLTKLPESRHGEALKFWKQWVSGDSEEPEASEDPSESPTQRPKGKKAEEPQIVDTNAEEAVQEELTG